MPVSTQAPGHGALTEVTDQDFAERVLGGAGAVLVEYWATWCGPCRMLGPVLAQIAAEQADKLSVVKLDIDANPVTARDQQIMAAPTLILYRAGRPVITLVGARSKSALLDALLPHLG
jgi:thioredoxin 1